MKENLSLLIQLVSLFGPLEHQPWQHQRPPICNYSSKTQANLYFVIPKVLSSGKVLIHPQILFFLNKHSPCFRVLPRKQANMTMLQETTSSFLTMTMCSACFLKVQPWLVCTGRTLELQTLENWLKGIHTILVDMRYFMTQAISSHLTISHSLQQILVC